MSQITIDIPDKLMPQLSRRAGELRQTPEAFVSNCLMAALQTDELPMPSCVATHEELEDLLESRDKGPWRTLPESWVERVMSQAQAQSTSRPNHG
jgi:plasmid stability protein